MTRPFDLLLRGGTVVTASGPFTGDIGVRDGRIAALGELGATADRIVDASGRIVMPGGIDPHCHIEQMSGMGVMNADTFETATRSAALGGTTSVISFAAQASGQGLRQTVEDYAARARRGAITDHAFHLSVTDVSAPGFDTDLAALIGEGHRSIKVFTTYNIRLDDRDILDVMAIARVEGALVCVHAENDGMIGWTRDALVAAGLTAPRHHPPSHPRLAEIETVERMCRFAEFLGQPVMLFHISTAEAADALRAARGRGVPVRGETCPHYLLMTEDALDRPGLEGAKWMCSPPQRTKADQNALWQALAGGGLDLVSSDHAPYRHDETGKLSAGPDAGFHQIANGLPGLETRLPLLFDAMISKGRAALSDFAALAAGNAARIYGLPGKGVIAPGMDADLVIWNPRRSHTYGKDDLHDNVGYNPWAGHTVTGWPEEVFLRGRQIVSDGICTGTPGSGRWLDRPDPGSTARTRPADEAVLVLEGKTA